MRENVKKLIDLMFFENWTCSSHRGQSIVYERKIDGYPKISDCHIYMDETSILYLNENEQAYISAALRKRYEEYKRIEQIKAENKLDEFLKQNQKT